MHTDPYASSGSDISTYGNLETLLNFTILATVGDSTTTSKGKSETDLWSSVHSLGEVKGASRLWGKKAVIHHWVLRGQFAQLHIGSCSLIVFQVGLSSQRQICGHLNLEPFTVPHVHTVSTQQTFRLSTKHSILTVPEGAERNGNRCWGGGRKGVAMACLASDRFHSRTKLEDQKVLILTWPTGEINFSLWGWLPE